MSTKLFVGNLSFNTSENDLQDLFAAYGPVQQVDMIMDRMTGRPRGFGCMTIALLTATLLANLLILPAILAGPLGYLFARRVQVKKPPAAEEPPRQSPPAPKSIRPLEEAPRIEPTRRSVTSK